MDYITIIRGAVLQVLIIAGPFLVVSLFLGLIISILQAVTAIQDQAITFVPKVVATLLILFFLGPWLLRSMQSYTVALMELIPGVS